MSFWDQVDKAGRRVFGRGNAGKVSLAARALRITAVVSAGGIVIGSSVASGGLALPIWAVAGLAGVMVLNGVAIPLSWTGNHMKVLQYEEAEAELLASTRQLHQQMARAGHAPSKSGYEIAVAGSRKLSDVNGAGGTILSIVSGAAEVGLIGVAPAAAAGFIIASRASSTLSTALNIPITKNRLAMHKAKLTEYQTEFKAACLKLDAGKSAAVTNIVECVFSELAIRQDDPSTPKENRRLNEQVHFALYKALFQSAITAEISETEKRTVIEAVKHVIAPSLLINVPSKKERLLPSMMIHENALKMIDKEHHYTTNEKPFLGINKNILSTLDGLAILEMKIQDNIMKQRCPHYNTVATLAEQATAGFQQNHTLTRHLQFHLRKTLANLHPGLLQHRQAEVIATIQATLSPYAKGTSGNCMIDSDKLQKSGLPEKSRKHGDFLPHYHLMLLGGQCADRLQQLQHPHYAAQLTEGERLLQKIFSAETGNRLNPDDNDIQQAYGILMHYQHAMLQRRNAEELYPLLSPRAQDHLVTTLQRRIQPYLQQKKRLGMIACDSYGLDKEKIIAAFPPRSDEEQKDKRYYHTAFSRFMETLMADYEREYGRVPSLPARGGERKQRPAPRYAVPVASGQQQAMSNTSASSYEILQASLKQHDLARQQHALEDFRRTSIPFILSAQGSDAHGNRILVWDDPCHKGNSAYQLRYTIHAVSAKVMVHYGKYASAIVAANAKPAENIGVQIMEITKGTHVMKGDKQNMLVALNHVAGVKQLRNNRINYNPSYFGQR